MAPAIDCASMSPRLLIERSRCHSASVSAFRRVPARTVTRPVRRSACTMPARRSRLSWMPSVAATEVNECPAPTGLTRSPRPVASATTLASSPTVAGAATVTSAETLPAQFVQVVMATTMELDDCPSQRLTWTVVQLWNGRMTTRLPVAERRVQLVEAARAVASAEGIAAATVRRVAEEAGVALGVVHYCFADKDELFAALAARIVDDLVTPAALAVDEATGVAAALRAAVDAMWASIEATAGEQLLTYEITTSALRSPGLRGVA